MRGKRLFWQIFFAHLGITAILLFSLGLYASQEARQLYLDQKGAELEVGAKACAWRVESAVGSERPGDLGAICQELAASLGMRITVILPSGEVIGESARDPRWLENHKDRPEIRQAMRGGVGRGTRFSTTLQEELMYVAVPMHRGGAVAAVARASLPIQTMAHTLTAVYCRIAAAAAVAATLVAGASLAVARGLARPLETLRSGAERFAQGELGHRLPIVGAEEVQRLAQSMNRMADQLDQRIQEIVRRENEHQAMLSSMEEGVLAVDQEARVLDLNGACARLLGVDREAARGRFIHEVVRRPGLLEFVERTLSSAAAAEEDLDFPGARDHSLHAHGAALRNTQGQNIGALIVLRDVSRLRHLENVRRDFVANVSHELRTPITSIKGFVETLLDEQLEDKQQSLRFLGIVLKQVNRLDAIIRDLLVLSRVERGNEEQTIELQPERLAAVLRSAVEMCENKAVDKRIRVHVDCPEELTVKINAALLEQAVVNLIDNAVKYSDPGSPVRVVGLRDADEVVIRVEDQGCGIAPVHLPRLFERFYRVDRARSRELGGTGLGLAIVKHIVAAHRGRVRVESAVSAGSTFFIHLPLGLTDRPPAGQHQGAVSE